MAEKRGVVYISDVPEGWPATAHTYEGHWEWLDAHERLAHEEGPGWDDPEQAITWGRERAPTVLVRIGFVTYSAGEDDPDDEAVPRVGVQIERPAQGTFPSTGADQPFPPD
jgi:hypothetical protein